MRFSAKPFEIAITQSNTKKTVEFLKEHPVPIDNKEANAVKDYSIYLLIR